MSFTFESVVFEREVEISRKGKQRRLLRGGFQHASVLIWRMEWPARFVA